MHIEGGAVRQGAAFFMLCLVDGAPIGIYNLSDQHRGDVHAVVGHGGIGVYHLEERHVVGAEGERGGILEFRRYAHIVRRLYHVVDAYLLPELYGNGVDTLRKGGAEGNVGVGEMPVGVVRLPNSVFSLRGVVDLHTYVRVGDARVSRGPALLHGGGIHE